MLGIPRARRLDWNQVIFKGWSSREFTAVKCSKPGTRCRACCKAGWTCAGHYHRLGINDYREGFEIMKSASPARSPWTGRACRSLGAGISGGQSFQCHGGSCTSSTHIASRIIELGNGARLFEHRIEGPLEVAARRNEPAIWPIRTVSERSCMSNSWAGSSRARCSRRRSPSPVRRVSPRRRRHPAGRRGDRPADSLGVDARPHAALRDLVHVVDGFFCRPHPPQDSA